MVREMEFRWLSWPSYLLAFLLGVGGCGEGVVEEPAEGVVDGMEIDSESRAPGERTTNRWPLALTFDDLPWVGALPPGESRVQPTGRILAALRKHDASAVGFVDCARIDPGAQTLRLWLDDGQQLGNHTADHVDLNDAPIPAWIAAARECDAELRELTGDTVVYFRYPYLHRGPTRERFEAGKRTLAGLGAPIAPVTIVTLDWLLNVPYTHALDAEDDARVHEIGRAFVEHVLRATAHYRGIARERTGGEIAQVLLLHANALVADHLDTLLARLEEDDAYFITLSNALEDPVYSRPDDYIGPEGLSWLYRFEPAMPELAEWDREEEARLRR